MKANKYIFSNTLAAKALQIDRYVVGNLKKQNSLTSSRLETFRFQGILSKFFILFFLTNTLFSQNDILWLGNSYSIRGTADIFRGLYNSDPSRVLIARVGDAWNFASNGYTDQTVVTEMYNKDGSHPENAGAYLAVTYYNPCRKTRLI